MANYSELAKQIIDLTGGKKNITESWHCVTRLRFNVVDTKKVKIDDIKQLKGVMGAQFSGDQFQVIIGNDVNDAFVEVSKELGLLEGQVSEKKGKQGVINGLMDIISGVFSPMLSAIAGTGLIKGFLALFTTLGWLSTEGGLYVLLNMISDSTFYFLPFFLAVTSARKFKTNEFLAMAVAGVLLYPTMTNGVNELMAGGTVTGITLLGGLPAPFIAYSSSVIPIILATYLLKHVHNFVKKQIPKAISVMFTPMFTLMIVVPITLVVLGPLGTYAGGFLSVGVTWLFEHLGIVGGALVGAFYPVLVMTGMHYALSPIMINNFAELGFDNSMMPATLMATFAMAGATFAVLAKVKNSEMKQVSLSAGISAVIGITEPAMYGVTLKLKKPFYGAMIGGGIAGAVVAVFKIKAFAMAMPGIVGLAGYIDPTNNQNFLVAIGGSVASFLVAFIATWLMGFDEEGPDKKEADKTDDSQKTITIHGAAEGKLIPVETVSDVTFSEKIMGYTVAIAPKSGEIVSPIEGEVVLIAETKHAIGLKSTEGVEVLVHVGIDTVELKGEGFTTKVSVGDRVSVSEVLLEVDLEELVAKGYDPTVLTIVTNSQDYLDIIPLHDTDLIDSGQPVASVIK